MIILKIKSVILHMQCIWRYAEFKFFLSFFYLRLQKGLKQLVLHNTNLPKTECLKILGSCLPSRNSITHLEISNYYYNFNTAFDTTEFLDIFRQFTFLEELKLDYFIFSNPKLIDIVAENERRSLKFLEIFFNETDLHSVIIPERKWHKLKAAYPLLKISFCISMYIDLFLASIHFWKLWLKMRTY